MNVNHVIPNGSQYPNAADANWNASVDRLTLSVIAIAILSRSCFSTLAGHTSTVWSMAFDCTGERLGNCCSDVVLLLAAFIGFIYFFLMDGFV